MKLFLIFCLLTIFTFQSSAQYSWVLKRSGSSLGNPIAVDNTNSNIVYFGTVSKIYRSTDRGESFNQYGVDIPSSTNIKAVILSRYNNSTMLVATTNKIVKTTDSGASWVTTADGLSFAYFGIPMTIDHKNPDTVYTMSGANFMKSTDFGSTWTTITSSVGCSSPCDIEVFSDSSNIILIGDNTTGIFRSTNYGQTWVPVYSTSGEIPTIAVDKLSAGVAYATKWGGGGGFVKSTNYGATWTPITFFDGKNMWGVDVSPTLSNYVTAGMYSGGTIYISRDAGLSWMPTSISASNYAVYVVDTITVFAAQGTGFFKLTSPYFVPVEFTSLTASAINENILISWGTATETNNRGFEIQRSSDDIKFETIGFVNGAGTSTEALKYSFAAKNAASGKSYFRLKQIDFDGTFTYTHSLEVDGFIPKVFSLNQNYPNPFNPATKISFALPVDSKVRISIYNAIGQLVSSFDAEEYTAGIHQLDFNASNLTSGIYFYSIEANGIDGSSFSNVKKMTLLK